MCQRIYSMDSCFLALQKKDTSVTFWAERIFFLSYLWHFYDDNDMSWLLCILACYLTLVGTWISPTLWDCNSITVLATSTSPSLYKMVDEDKEARIHSIYPLTNSLYQISIGSKFHECHFGYTSALPCKTNPCRKMNFNYKWCSQLLMIYINLSTLHKFNYMTKFITTTQGMSFHLREA